ncbi:MAG: DUF1501 domain-containing protein [Burkholderiales bacterium]|nr:DUF1501 domain-containing protein [Burkholderiales bacterium]
MSKHPNISRRQLLAASALLPVAQLSLGAASSHGSDNRFVLMILRGGMDGLGAVPAPGDPAFAAARGALGEFTTPALPLAGPFALNPALAQLHAMYGRGEMSVLHAIGLPYKERSHFEAQQLLESGGQKPHEISTGWLGRALAANRAKGVAMQTAVPLVLRGPASIDTWTPSVLPDPAPDLVSRLARLYESDADLALALQRARELRADGVGMAAGASMAPGAPRVGALTTLVKQAAEFLSKPGGPQVAVLEMGGWDTHANQANPQGPLTNNLRALDGALATLRESLDASGRWARTVVIVCTEFGREVAINGTQGTDHGSGGAAFVLGGAVAGGKVIADWPGLAVKERFEGRDLRITTDLRAAFKTVLRDHLQVASTTIERDALPGSAGIAPLAFLKT